ncbi:hypothetical protein FOC93_02125 (plasmid) [Bacillus cereus]|uniref:hypothetical protein n=1 Tax=Bacillus cereus TaxID=1396 RepID=UPI0015600DD3|nr:hypothetical protein [Bacillus cereus]QKH05007.1 hypothetical protein FOC93_02125 [Bacillus cereus]QKH10907.1 hypothetical protein FOC92_02650 [Bacillus cereus]
MKNKLIAAGIVTGTLLSFPSNIFADSISKVSNMSPSNKQIENAVVGVITDADEYFATVEYKDSKGNTQTVEIDFPNGSNSSYKIGNKVQVSNKDQWKQQKYGTVNVTYTSANSLSKVTDETKNNVEPSKRIENAVVGVITDADEYFATVEYKDSKGNTQTVEIDFPNGSNSSYKIGNKVQVSNKDQWKQQKYGTVNVTYTSANSLSKVTDETKNNVEPSKRIENAVVGVITDADEYFATVEYKDSKGNTQTVEIDFPNGSNSSYKIGNKVQVSNKDQWKQQKYGTVNVTYTSAHSLSKVTDEAKNKVEPSKQVKNKKITGNVIKKSKNTIVVSSKDTNSEVSVEVPSELLQDITIGDTVNIYATSFESPNLLPGTPLDAISPIVEKINNK